MISPFKFIQGVKNEAFKVSWPTGRETLTGAVMVVLLAIVAAIFFLILDQILKFFLNFAIREGGKTVGAGVVTKILE